MLDEIYAWLNICLDGPANDWLDGRLQQVAKPFKDSDIYIAFGMMSRKPGKIEFARYCSS